MAISTTELVFTYAHYNAAKVWHSACPEGGDSHLRSMKEYTALEFRMIQKAMQFFQENPTVSPKAIAAYVGPSAQKGFIHILKRALACIRPADINPR